MNEENVERVESESSVWLDLSRPIVEGSPVYPGDPLFSARPFAECATDGFRGTLFSFGSHLGTHLDFPFHYFVDGETLDAFPVDFFFGKTAVLDFRDAIGIDSPRFAARLPERPAALTVDDLEPFDSVVESVSFLFLQTGWSARLGASDYYTDFPSLSREVCEWLVGFSNLRVLGLETPSLVSFPRLAADGDRGREENDDNSSAFDPEFGELLPTPDPRVEELRPVRVETSSEIADSEIAGTLDPDADADCHRVLLGADPPILILEGLTSLDALPKFGADDICDDRVPFDSRRVFETACPPLPIVGADGCPVRVVAKLEVIS